jgi:hypothetical protein
MRRILAFGAVVAACAAVAACALAASASFAVAAAPAARTASTLTDDDMSARVLYDCASSRYGYLRHRYSMRVLRGALRDIPEDVANYTNCPDAIRAAIGRATARITVSIRRKRGGPAAAGRIALLDLDGRAVDVLTVRRRQAAEFLVPRGTYVVRVDGRRGCSSTEHAQRWRTTIVRITCRR